MGSIAYPKSTGSTTPAWETLSQILPRRDAAKNYWWDLTGLHLAILVHEAGYSLAKQYEALLFHYHWTVPYFGPGPGPKGGPAVWTSLLGPDGSPIEYSWKWNGAKGGHPAIRYSIEPISEAAGSTVDPLNQQAATEMIHRLAAQVPGVDLKWTDHFLATLFDHDKSKYAQEAAEGAHYTTTFMLAAEFDDSGLSFKSYFIPRKLGQPKGLIPLPLWKESLAQLQPKNNARDLVYDFVETSAEGKKLVPMILAVDTVDTSKSRLKFYFQTASTSFASAREIMTAGGRVPLSAAQLEELRSLIGAVTGTPDDFPEDAHVERTRNYNPAAVDNFVELPELLSGYIYYFDMAPTSARPDVKLYVPTRHVGPDDLSVARALIAWLEKRGRAAYGQQYMNMLEGMAAHRRLDQGKGLQTYIGIMFKKNGDLDVTSYLGAEAFDPMRVASAIRGPARPPRYSPGFD
ncbi:dimethylallyl tryptophan synthase GliD1 [Durotheca rogersii]|uniref:dimethylallyl tryptophan synthase GliD1 n=1 Tax=Durotheca rogersii TaxID=419775 RepID=UPI00221F55DB|nr:dimethylallyl tryptophan synthase GliD1 [Durotheca rogersii]KAI5866009.1 dimethylallyl tryptophan synthase GliD1 [Durotheca rogersii]